MSNSHLLPFSPTARYVRLTHQEHKSNRESLRRFILRHRLAEAFVDKVELNRAIRQDELWLVRMTPAGCSHEKIFAAATFAALVLKSAALESESFGGTVDDLVKPPFPHHSHLAVECTRESTGHESWSMTWEEYIGTTYSLKSASLGAMWLRGLEISAANAEATLRAFERLTTAH